MRLAPIVRYFGFMANSPMENGRARDGALRIGKKDVVHEGVKCLPTASSAAHTQGTGLRHLPFLRAARRKYTPVIRERGRAGNGLKGHPSIEQSGRQESTRDAADVRFGS